MPTSVSVSVFGFKLMVGVVLTRSSSSSLHSCFAQLFLNRPHHYAPKNKDSTVLNHSYIAKLEMSTGLFKSSLLIFCTCLQYFILKNLVSQNINKLIA